MNIGLAGNALCKFSKLRKHSVQFEIVYFFFSSLSNSLHLLVANVLVYSTRNDVWCHLRENILFTYSAHLSNLDTWPSIRSKMLEGIW